jgi:hypothetical protein
MGLYALSLVAALGVLDRWRPMAYNTGSLKWQQFERLAAAAPDRPLLVMLGSSRTDAAFQAGRFNGLPGPDGKPLLAYNFGVPAAGPIHDLLYLRKMLDAGARPSLLLVEYLPLLLNEPRKGLISEESWTSAPWRSGPEMLLLSPYFSSPGTKYRDWLAARLAPWLFFRYHFQTWMQESLFATRPPRGEYRHDAWGRKVPEGFDAMECARRVELTRHYYAASLQQLRLGDGPVRALRDLAALCRREKVPLVLVVTPESTEFRSWYSPEALAPADRLLAELRDAGAQVIDARGWVEDRDFQDGHHVMAGGSYAFTTRLLEELRPMLAHRDNGDRAPPSMAHASLR